MQVSREKILFGAGLAALALVAAAVVVISTTSPPRIGGPDQGLVSRPPESPILPGPQQAAQAKSETKLENTLSVSGTGVAKTNPDRVLVSLSMSAEAKTAQAATEKAATTFNKLLTALTAEGIPRNDIQTTLINLSPVYIYPKDKAPEITGYRLDHSIIVTVKSQDTSQLGKQAGKVIDVSISAGATRINGVSFTVGEEAIKVLRTQALKTAIDDAKDKANTMANALGVKIVGVNSVSESVFIPRPTPVFKGAAEAVVAAPPTEIVPGEFQATVSVSVNYGISD